MENTLNKGVAVYLRGCLPEYDNSYCVMAAGINRKHDEHGRKVAFLIISLDGETVVDYDLKRDDCPSKGIDRLYRAFFDGTILDQLKLYDDKKTALYCRTASDDLLALESQMTALYRCGEDKGYNLCAAYCDNAESGINLSRPCLNKLIADIRAGEVKRVLISERSRLSRSYHDMLKLFRLFVEHNVELVSLGEGGVVDMDESQKIDKSLNELIRLYRKTSRKTKSV